MPGSRPAFEEPGLAKATQARSHFLGAGQDAVGHVMKAEYSLDLPLELQIDFAQVLQVHVGSAAGRIDAGQIGDIFDREYMIRKRTTALLLQCAGKRSSLWLASAGSARWHSLPRARTCSRFAPCRRERQGIIRKFFA